MQEGRGQNTDTSLNLTSTSLNHAKSSDDKEAASSDDDARNPPDLNSHDTPADIALKEPLPPQVAI